MISVYNLYFVRPISFKFYNLSHLYHIALMSVIQIEYWSKCKNDSERKLWTKRNGEYKLTHSKKFRVLIDTFPNYYYFSVKA